MDGRSHRLDEPALQFSHFVSQGPANEAVGQLRQAAVQLLAFVAGFRLQVLLASLPAFGLAGLCWLLRAPHGYPVFFPGIPSFCMGIAFIGLALVSVTWRRSPLAVVAGLVLLLIAAIPIALLAALFVYVSIA